MGFLNMAEVTIDILRGLCNDTDPTAELIADETYQAIISYETNAYSAAAAICRAIAAKYASKTTVKAGPVMVKNDQKSANYLAMAKAYEAQARLGGGSYDSDGSLPVVGGACSEPIFTIGMHDNG